MSVVSHNIISIADWKVNRFLLAHGVSVQIGNALQIPTFFKRTCFLYMYGDRPEPQKILAIKIIPDDANFLKSLWAIFNYPIGSSFGKQLIRLFRSHGIKRSEVQPGDFIYREDENVAHEFTASGFNPKEK